MARLNLICNGMLLFDDTGDGNVQITIPTITGHVRKFCSAPIPTQALAKDLAVGSYTLTGPVSSHAKLRSLVSPLNYLVVDKKSVNLDTKAAAKVSAVITVPMPKLIRLFRASEPSGSIFGNTPVGAAVERPAIHHDVVVFCYSHLTAGTKIVFGPTAGKPIAAATLSDTDVANWIFYSTEENPLTIGSPPHSTDALNSLLKFNGNPTDFVLSAIGRKDGPNFTGMGMTTTQMLAFHELPAAIAGPVPQADSGDLGCSGVFRG